MNLRLRAASLVAAIALTAAAASAEETGEISAEIFSAKPLVRAYALVIREAAGTDVPQQGPDAPITDPLKPATVTKEARIEQIADDRWRLTAPLTEQDMLPKTRVTFVATSADGLIIPGPLAWVNPPVSSAQPAEALCQARPDRDQIQKLFSLDERALRTLLEVRATRAEVLEKSLRKLLTPDVIEKLISLEHELGLNSSPQLDADLELEELTRRIGLIESVLKSQ